MQLSESIPAVDAPLIEVRGLSKIFGAVAAVRDVSFQVKRGEVVGFLGPNGAGKTTTMRMLAGYLPSSNGSARLCGVDVASAPHHAQKRLGYLAEGAPLYGDMTAEGLLGYVASLHGLRGAARRQRMDEMIERVALREVLFRRIETLSKGFRRRVALSLALVHDPDVLILDEPTDGLDPNQKQTVRDLIREIAPHKAILISTHLLDEIDSLCDRVLVIDDGRLVHEGTAAGLRAGAPDHNSITALIPVAAAGRATALVEHWADVERVEATILGGSAQVRVVPRRGIFLADRVADTWRQAGIDPHDLAVEPGRLEDAFRALTVERRRAEAERP